MGGFHVQFNAVGPDVLRDAQKNPENYSDLLVRVAGYTDSEMNIKHVAWFARGLKTVIDIELLPYRWFGETKYVSLHRTYPLSGTNVLSDEALENLEKVKRILSTGDLVLKNIEA